MSHCCFATKHYQMCFFRFNNFFVPQNTCVHLNDFTKRKTLYFSRYFTVHIKTCCTDRISIFLLIFFRIYDLFNVYCIPSCCPPIHLARGKVRTVYFWGGLQINFHSFCLTTKNRFVGRFFCSNSNIC